MQKLFFTVALWSAGMVLVGSSFAQTQQTPAAKPSTAPATKAPAKKATTTTPAAKETAPAALSTRKDKFSYALGMNVGLGLGANLKRDSVEFDPKLVAAGLLDTLSSSKTRLTEQEAQAVVKEVAEEVRKAAQERSAKAAVSNKAEGETFLTANKAREGVVTLPSGLQYKILTAGTGPKPTTSDTVVCNYKGTLINGTEFDSSYKRGQPATFPVSGVIKGWTEALQLMQVGSKWQLFIPSNLAYGERGAGADIGPSATLIFEVELLSIQPKEQPKPAAAGGTGAQKEQAPAKEPSAKDPGTEKK